MHQNQGSLPYKNDNVTWSNGHHYEKQKKEKLNLKILTNVKAEGILSQVYWAFPSPSFNSSTTDESVTATIVRFLGSNTLKFSCW